MQHTDEEEAESGSSRSGRLEVHLRHGLAGHAGEDRLEIAQGEKDRQEEYQSEGATERQKK